MSTQTRHPELTFYQEPSGTNCIAVGPRLHNPNLRECVAGVYSTRRSPVATTAIHRHVLEDFQKVTEAEARGLHPELFDTLDGLR